MAGRRLSMRKIKEVLRLKWQRGHSNKQIAVSCKISRSTTGQKRQASPGPWIRPWTTEPLKPCSFPLNPPYPLQSDPCRPWRICTRSSREKA